MIALESGTAFAYAINNLQDRGKFFIEPQDAVYAGQIVGEHIHEKDLVVNVTKSKQLTNMRASGSDEKARIVPATILSLEEALEYIREDEYVEVTPKSMRMRKIILDHLERKRQPRLRPHPAISAYPRPPRKGGLSYSILQKIRLVYKMSELKVISELSARSLT